LKFSFFERSNLFSVD